MLSFSDYIHPITSWLQVHPYWALFFTFIVSFAESLAIIGSLIPGSISMTAIGILAGSGVMRVDFTLIAATLGAIAGDSSSYLLGYTYSDTLYSIWPFRNYPSWLSYGKKYFAQHGGKSILIGRFVGPLRSIIPVIAGMMRMNHWQFLAANVISAIGWSLLFVLPGVMIGTASNELSAQSATHLFVVVLLFLAGLWLLSIGAKWLQTRIKRLFRTKLYKFYIWSNKHPPLTNMLRVLTPLDENNPYRTINLCFELFFSLILFAFITLLMMHGHLIASINQPPYLFLQSLRVFSFDPFFIIAKEFTSNITLFSSTLAVLIITLYQRDWRSMTYWLSLNVSCGIILFFTHFYINSPFPGNSLEIQLGNSYPAIQLTFATAQFSALLFYLQANCRHSLKPFITIFFSIILFIAGVASLYLGDHWVLDVLSAYALGFSVCLLHWILYRRRQQITILPNQIQYTQSEIYQASGQFKKIRPYPLYLTLVIFCSIFIATLISLFFNYEQSVRVHQPYLAQYVFSDQVWWNQKKPLLPIYRSNRIGKRISLFNIQYAGLLRHLEAALLASGWHKQKESLFKTLLTRVNGQYISQDTPFMAPLYLNRKPVLIMTYQPKDAKTIQILRIWRSNYHLKHFHQPIWIGTVNPYMVSKKQDYTSSLRSVSESLSFFPQRKVPFFFTLPFLTSSKAELLLIKDPSS